jgi:hypothetical protein
MRMRRSLEQLKSCLVCDERGVGVAQPAMPPVVSKIDELAASARSLGNPMEALEADT